MKVVVAIIVAVLVAAVACTSPDPHQADHDIVPCGSDWPSGPPPKYPPAQCERTCAQPPPSPETKDPRAPTLCYVTVTLGAGSSGVAPCSYPVLSGTGQWGCCVADTSAGEDNWTSAFEPCMSSP